MKNFSEFWFDSSWQKHKYVFAKEDTGGEFVHLQEEEEDSIQVDIDEDLWDH